jgi:hypothetical protein
LLWSWNLWMNGHDFPTMYAFWAVCEINAYKWQTEPNYTGHCTTLLIRITVATLSFGAGQPSFPMKPMSRTCPRNRIGVGTGRPDECILTRFRISFSAHVRTILRGLCRQ